MKGNVIDMAVGDYQAFGKNRLLHCGRCDYASIAAGGRCQPYRLEVVLKPAEMVDGKEIAAVTLNTVILAGHLRLPDYSIPYLHVWQLLTKLTEKKKEEAPAAPPAPPAPSKEEVLLTKSVIC